MGRRTKDMNQPVDRPDQPPVVATMTVHGADELAPARRLLTDSAIAVGLSADRIERFTIALSEVVTNALQHGDGSAVITIIGSATALIVQVRDHGPGLRTSQRAALPEPTQIGGRGLWLAHQLCDQVDIDSSPSGTTARMTMRL